MSRPVCRQIAVPNKAITAIRKPHRTKANHGRCVTSHMTPPAASLMQPSRPGSGLATPFQSTMFSATTALTPPAKHVLR